MYYLCSNKICIFIFWGKFRVNPKRIKNTYFRVIPSNTNQLISPQLWTFSHKIHNLWDVLTIADHPNTPLYTTRCLHITVDCVTHDDKSPSNHRHWGLSPLFSSVFWIVRPSIHDKLHIGILLCLLSDTWKHSKSSCSSGLHGPAWNWWTSNPFQHIHPLVSANLIKEMPAIKNMKVLWTKRLEREYKLAYLPSIERDIT